MSVGPFWEAATESMYRALLAVDVESSGGRDNQSSVVIREALFDALRKAFGSSQIDWGSCQLEDTGDGMTVIVPPEIPKSTLIFPMLDHLAAALRHHNRYAGPTTKIRVRVALHAGDVRVDKFGGTTGRPKVLLARLLNSEPLRRALAEGPESTTVAHIVSQSFYEDVVRQGNVGIDPERYAQVTVAVKETSTVAWISVGVPEARRDAFVGNGRRRRRVTLALGAGAAAIALGWSLIVATGPRASEPESGEPVSLVGEPKVTGSLEFALPDPLTSGPDYEALQPTSDREYNLPTNNDRYVSVDTLAVSFQIKGNRQTPVQITDIKPEITGKDQPLAGTLVVYPPPGGQRPAIKLLSNLDTPPLTVRDPGEFREPWFTQHHVELAKDENQQFQITFSGRQAAYSFRIVVEYSSGDSPQGRLVITGRHGRPFRVTGHPVDGGRYGIVYLPNFPKGGGGWHACGAWAEDRCTR